MFAIAGVSGRTGSVVATDLLRRGHHVRAIVRTEAAAQAWRAQGADAAIASLADADALGHALRGAAAAYLLLPTDMTSADIVTEHGRTVDAMARAIITSRVPHVVFLSSIGAQHREGTGIIGSLYHAERRLRLACPRVTFLRPGFFLENWLPAIAASANGRLPTFLDADRKIAMVATRDVGLIAAHALLRHKADRCRIVQIAGPRDQSPRQIAALLAAIQDRRVDVEALPLAAVVPTLTAMGASMSVAEQYRQMFAGYHAGLLTHEECPMPLMRGATDARTMLVSSVARHRAAA